MKYIVSSLFYLAISLPLIYFFNDSIIVLGLIFVSMIAYMIVQLVCMVQRFHDVGLSGWWYLVGFVPIVGGIAVMVVLFLPTNTFDQYDTYDEVAEQ